jgi:predicted phage terminase large subunit-like protein
MTEADPRTQQLKAVRRIIAAKEAHGSLLEYMRLSMPDPEDIDDVTKSRYQVTPQARLLCEIMEKVEQRKMKRVAVSIGPQMGKSDIISRKGPAWIEGRNPYTHMILGSYNQTFAEEFGHEVRQLVEAPFHQQVFPGFSLVKGGTAKDLLVTEQGGKMAFVGIGGSGTGKPADIFLVDDPYRGYDDANSAAFRERVWKWFNGVVFSRTHDETAIVVVQTRWHEDDLIGRLCDPNHPEREGLYRGLEKRWTYINIPAVVEDEKLAKALGLKLEIPTDPAVVEQFGTKPMSALWPGRKSLPLLAEAKQSDPRTFGALYMGRPAPDEGEFFKLDWLVEYDRELLPKNLRKYGASDHALSMKTGRDLSCLGCAGIDEEDHIWVLPDLAWRRMETDRTVEEMLVQFKIHRPALWWLESELISKSFGPFLKRRMQEEKIYATLDPIGVSKDIQTRARAIQGRMAMGMVHFPRFAPWWQQAKQQILTFPYAAHDDFVAWLALIGLGLTKEHRASTPKKEDARDPAVGSMTWILRKAHERAKRKKRDDARAGW